jgi:hypothetical protein
MERNLEVVPDEFHIVIINVSEKLAHKQVVNVHK